MPRCAARRRRQRRLTPAGPAFHPRPGRRPGPSSSWARRGRPRRRILQSQRASARQGGSHSASCSAQSRRSAAQRETRPAPILAPRSCASPSPSAACAHSPALSRAQQAIRSAGQHSAAWHAKRLRNPVYGTDQATKTSCRASQAKRTRHPVYGIKQAIGCNKDELQRLAAFIQPHR